MQKTGARAKQEDARREVFSIIRSVEFDENYPAGFVVKATELS